MKCNYCQKDIERGKEVKVNHGLLTTNRIRGKKFFSPLLYHQECWQVICQKRKQERKYFWILMIIIFSFLLSLLALMLFVRPFIEFFF